MVSLSGRLGALHERPFRLLWLGQSASAVGDSLIPVALAFAVLEDLGGTTGDLGLVLGSFTLSRVLFILVGGVWADRLPRRLVMLVCDGLRAGTQALVAVGLFAGALEVWMLAAASAVTGASAAFFGPASTGLIPQTVSRGRLQQANALVSLSQSGTGVFGPALSGLLVVAVGPGWVFAIDALTYVASALFLVLLRLGPAGAAAVRETFVADLARGWREISYRPWLWASLMKFSLGNLAIAAFFVLGPLVAKEELGGAGDWGLILTLGALGGVLGSAIALRVRPSRPLVVGSLVILPVAGQLLALVPPLPAVAIGLAMAAASVGINVGNALWDTVLQANVPADVISRVSSYDWLVSLVFMPMGFTLAGPLAGAIGLDVTLVLAATLVVAANLGVLAVRDLREMGRPEGRPQEPASAPLSI